MPLWELVPLGGGGRGGVFGKEFPRTGWSAPNELSLKNRCDEILLVFRSQTIFTAEWAVNIKNQSTAAPAACVKVAQSSFPSADGHGAR